jgi:hypothetical protein
MEDKVVRKTVSLDKKTIELLKEYSKRHTGRVNISNAIRHIVRDCFSNVKGRDE